MDEIDFFLLHQANLRIIEAVAKRLHQPWEKISHKSAEVWKYFLGERADFT